MYSFDDFIKLIRQGREIEFIYNGYLFSFTRLQSGKQMCINNVRNGTIFQDDADFISFIKEFNLEGLQVKDIIEKKLYKKNSLFVL